MEPWIIDTFFLKQCKKGLTRKETRKELKQNLMMSKTLWKL